MAMKIIIDSEVHKKILYWVNKSQYEVSGFGNVVLDKDGVFRVISAVLTKQENRSAETDIKAQDVAKALFESRDAPGEMKWWWHSHVSMPVFWSNTDHQAMRDFASTPDSWIICTVFNKKNELRSCYFAPEGCDTPWGKSVLMFDELPTSMESSQAQIDAWESEYQQKVTNVTYTSYKHHWSKGNERPAAERPPGISKRDWKALKKKEAAQAADEKGVTVTGLADADKFSVDEYGFNQNERTILAMSGWTLQDIDYLIEKKFTARQIVMLCEADYLAEDVLKLLAQDGATVLSIMKDVAEILIIRDEVKGNIDTEISDDVPVADRGRSVIDMRDGGFGDPDTYYDRFYS